MGKIKKYNPFIFNVLVWLLKKVYRNHNIVVAMSEFKDTKNHISNYTFLNNNHACGFTFGLSTQILDLIGKKNEKIGQEIYVEHLNNYFKDDDK